MARVVVIGGGIIGLCTALYCLDAGLDVTVLESGPEDGKPCSWGNAGMVVPSHIVPLAAPGMVQLGLRMLLDRSSPFGIHWQFSWELVSWTAQFVRSCTRSHVERAAPFLNAFNALSRELYADLEGRVGGLRFERTGLLELHLDQASMGHDRATADLARRLGQEVETLDREGVHALEPEALPDVAGGYHYRGDAHVDPVSTLRSLHRHLTGAGAKLLYGQEVVDFELASDCVLACVTETGRHEADSFVIAAGVWSGAVARLAGHHTPLVSGKGYSFVVDDPPVRPRVPSILVGARVAVAPLGDGTRFSGTMEIGGSLSSTNWARVRGIREGARRFYPAYRGVEFRDDGVWQGLRPCSPDGVPVIGPVPGWKNLVLATGHAMMGMSLGPATGLVVSQMLQGRSTSLDLHPALPARFS